MYRDKVNAFFTMQNSKVFSIVTLKWLIDIIVSVIGLSINILDAFMIIVIPSIYYVRDDTYYLGLTVLLFVGPPLITVIYLMIFHQSDEDDDENSSCEGIVCILSIWLLIVAPIVHLLQLGWEVREKIKGRFEREYAHDMGTMAPILRAVTVSFPQGCLQSFIIFQASLHGSSIDVYQWIFLATSLTSLAYNVSTTQGFFNEATPVSQAVFFFHGIMTVTSRIAVACLFSLAEKGLFFLPIGVELTAVILIWIFKRWMNCSQCISLAKDPHCSAKKSSVLMIVFTWLLTSTYNNFTLSGMVISSLNLMFAVGGYFLPVPEAVAVLVLTLAIISFVASVIFTSVPKLRYIGIHWLDVNEDGESLLY